jgi:hypothetical protein
MFVEQTIRTARGSEESCGKIWCCCGCKETAPRVGGPTIWAPRSDIRPQPTGRREFLELVPSLRALPYRRHVERPPGKGPQELALSLGQVKWSFKVAV